MNKNLEQLTVTMLKNYKSRFVCTVNTDLVLEGFPRSGNTFSVDFLDHLSKGRKLNIAHHTHNFRNLRLGVELGVPCAALIRSPLEAVSSYMIYSGRNVDEAANYYYEFYYSLMDIKSSISYIKFEEVVTNMNDVIIQLNEKYNLDLQISNDLQRDSEIVKNISIERAKKTRTNEQFIKTVGSPNKERDLLKKEIKQHVLSHFSTNTEVVKLYEEIVSN